jgi:hypothetical protein
MEAGEGDGGDGVGEEGSSDVSSRGVGGLAKGAIFAGTDRDRNEGIGKAEAAGDAWKAGPAYSRAALTGVEKSVLGVSSELVGPAGEITGDE